MRSKFLVHWTGKDIELEIHNLSDISRDKYIERLIEILESGFWMTTPTENLGGGNSVNISYLTHMTCFTEVKLSNSNQHAKQYGLLGVAVDRAFVLDRWGSPVHYVRNHQYESIVANFDALYKYLENVIKKKEGEEEKEAINKKFQLQHLFTFLKSMSEHNQDDFKYLNEHEWRIVHTFQMVEKNNIIKCSTPPPKYKIPLLINDLKLLIFPDEITRQLAIENEKLKNLFSKHNNYPPMLTLDECEQF